MKDRKATVHAAGWSWLCWRLCGKLMVTACWASVRASILPLAGRRKEVLGFCWVVDSNKSKAFLVGGREEKRGWEREGRGMLLPLPQKS